ncbi:MAG: hypothetical protein ACEPOW_08260 [Bacteroidales bacterium]
MKAIKFLTVFLLIGMIGLGGCKEKDKTEPQITNNGDNNDNENGDGENGDDENGDDETNIPGAINGSIQWKDYSGKLNKAYYIFKDKSIHIFLYTAGLEVVEEVDEYNHVKYEFKGSNGIGVHLKTNKHDSGTIRPGVYLTKLTIGKLAFDTAEYRFLKNGEVKKAISKEGEISITKSGENYSFKGVKLTAFSGGTSNSEMIFSASGKVPLLELK